VNVKVFTSQSGAALESSVNTWLAENAEIAITTAVQSATVIQKPGSASVEHQIVLTVFYTAAAINLPGAPAG
jgi:hypothetical protein